MSSVSGIIFDFQGFSIYDGPGCRSLIFLKGCVLRCEWCANPEGQEIYPVPMFEPSKCLHGGECARVCEHHAIKIDNNTLTIDREKCADCRDRKCAEPCTTEALKIAGYKVTVDELMQKITRDRKYWGKGGGITLTGGEPFFQHEFAYELLKKCSEKYIHTAVETEGCVPWESIEKSIEYVDWMFFDIKHIDPVIHKKITGHDNTEILDNLKRIAGQFKNRLIIRMVAVPGVSDSDEYIQSFINFLKGLGRKQLEVNILPLHHLAREKYKMLGREYFTETLDIPGNEKFQRINGIFDKNGMICYIGGDTPF
ncbi:MAG: glycyl-radical enzyme activating protein [Candidatus Xenobiia bacterium LiM19]